MQRNALREIGWYDVDLTEAGRSDRVLSAFAPRQQVFDAWTEEGKDMSAYPDPAEDEKGLMDISLDGSELAQEADKLVQSNEASDEQRRGPRRRELSNLSEIRQSRRR